MRWGEPQPDIDVVLIDVASGTVLKQWTAKSFSAYADVYEVDGAIYDAVRMLRVGRPDGTIRSEVYVRARPSSASPPD